MRIGVFTPFSNPFATAAIIKAVGQAADRAGFASMWLPEHVVLFDEYGSNYPYSPDGKLAVPAESGLLEPFTTMGFLAACTENIRIGTAICLLPQRNPVYVAKEVSNLDYLSDGRINLGIGVGWLKEEFDVLNIDFARRGARTDEYIQILKTLWCDPVSEFSGEFHQLPACRMYPKPVQSPHPLLYIGGESDAALKRVARLGQGWHGFNHTAETAAERIAKLSAYIAAEGRARSDVDVTVAVPMGLELSVDDVKRYRDAGVDQLTIPVFAADADQAKDMIDALAETILTPAAAL